MLLVAAGGYSFADSSHYYLSIPLKNLNEIYGAIMFDYNGLVHRTRQPILDSVNHAPRYFTLIVIINIIIMHLRVNVSGGKPPTNSHVLNGLGK